MTFAFLSENRPRKSILQGLLAASFLVAAGCSNESEPHVAVRSAKIEDVPFLGEFRRPMEQRLANFLIKDESVIEFYRFSIHGTMLRLSFQYAIRKDGKDILQGVNIRSNPDETSESGDRQVVAESARQEILRKVIPDRKPIAIVDLPSAVREDGENTEDSQSAFFSSYPIAKSLFQHPHWDIPQKRWEFGPCRESSPDIVQVNNHFYEGKIVRTGIYSEYLYECMMRDI